MTEARNRQNIIIPISVPVFCAAINAEGNPVNLRMSVATNVSASGMVLELYNEIDSDLVLLSFTAVYDRSLELKGKVVSSTKMESGAFKLDISFQGSHSENIEFAKHLVIMHNRMGQKPVIIIDKEIDSSTK